VGSAERWEYAAVGDDVNVLVSKFTRDLVEKLPVGCAWKSIGIQTLRERPVS